MKPVRPICCTILAVTLAACLLAPLCAADPADPTDLITDVLVGHNNKGPYTLSWTDVVPDSVSVVLSGRSLRRGSDYNMDFAKGSLAFNAVLVNDAIVRVSYRRTPNKSQRTIGALNVPVTLNLVDRQSGNLQVTGLYAQDDPNNPDAGKSVVGLGGTRRFARTNLSTLFLMSQRNESDPNATQGDTWERSAFKFGSDTGVGALKLSAGFLHSGSEFAGGSEYGVGQGKEATDLAATFAPNKTVQAGATFKQTENTAGDAKGTTSVENAQNLTVAPMASTRISLAHTTTDIANATSGAKSSVETSTVNVDQQIGKATTAKVALQSASLAGGGAADQQQTRQASLSTTALPGTSLQASVVQKDSQVTGQQTTTDVGVQIKAAGNTEIKGHVVTDTTKDNQQFQRDATVTTAPTRYAKLTAGFSQKGVNDQDDVTKQTTLELLPFTHTRLAAGYQYVETGQRVMTITDYSATSKPVRFISLSGRYRNREAASEQMDDTTAVQVALMPAEFLSLTGDYQLNPEDEKGAVQAQKATGYGMCLHVGSVAVSGNYTTKDEYRADRLSDERKLGFELPCFGRGRLSTGLALARTLDGSEYASRMYTFGYKHDVGERFTLSLTGYYTQYLKDKMLQQEKAETGVEAGLGMKF